MIAAPDASILDLRSIQVGYHYSTFAPTYNLMYVPKLRQATPWVTDAHAGSLISEVLGLEDNTGWEFGSELPRAVIMSGVTQNELHLLMSGSRQAGMKPPLWATLTPTSETWAVQDLLKELAAEHQAMQKKKP
jgi:hypothetical protein